MNEYDVITYIAQPFIVFLMIISPIVFFYMLDRSAQEK